MQTTLADVKEKACQEHSQTAALVILTIDGESCEDRLDQTLSDLVPTGKRVSLVLQQVRGLLYRLTACQRSQCCNATMTHLTRAKRRAHFAPLEQMAASCARLTFPLQSALWASESRSDH